MGGPITNLLDEPFKAGEILRRRVGRKGLGVVLRENLVGRVVEAGTLVELLIGYTGREPCEAYADLGSGVVRIAYCRPRLEVEVRGLITYYIINRRGVRTARPEDLVRLGICTPGLSVCTLGDYVNSGVVEALVRVDDVRVL
mgnify:CR=1 FL=1